MPDAPIIVGTHRIGADWCASTHEPFPSHNPARWDEVIGTFPTATTSEVEAAIEHARIAYPKWRAMSRILRGECFDRLAKLIERDLEAISTLMARECGKNISECRAEVVEGLHMVQYVFGSARMPMGEVLASEIADKDVSVRRKPWGVVAVITPWNFPFAVPLWMLGPSLLEGNTAIFKPSEDTPAVGQKIVELFIEAGFPAGVIQLLHGGGAVGEQLVRDERINVVLFTGSYDVGRRIQQLSAEHFNRIVAAEMGSKSAVIIAPDAKLDLAVSATILSAFKTSGQRCVSAGRVLVAESLLGPFTERLITTARRLRIGDPLDASNFMGPLIHPAAVEKVLHYNALARAEGAEVLLDGGRVDGNYLSPFIYQLRHRPEFRCLREEVFGPHLAIIPFRDLDEAIAIYNATDYGLSLGLITEDYRTMRRVREECEFGMGYVNLPCIGAEVHLPFGGVKKSGNGHPSAAGLIDTVTHRIAWTVNHAREIKMAQGLTTDM